MPTLSALYIYPIKSLRGIALDHCAVTSRGFEHDRRWMLVDAKGKFLTQRQQPRLALVSVALGPEALLVTAPGMDALQVPYHLQQGDALRVKVWGDECEALGAGESRDRWFSHYLGVECHLVYMPESTQRHVDADYAVSTHDVVSFADGFPFLLISEASLEDLNSRLTGKGETAVPMKRFRPNLVVSGCEAYAEDQWRDIRIGALDFKVVKPCSRCVVPTIDTETGVKAREPLLTLTEYRKRENKVYFGQNLVHLPATAGPSVILHVGDKIDIQNNKIQQ